MQSRDGGERGGRGAGRFAWILACAAVACPARADEPSGARTSSLSWIRLPGADACVSAQDLARAVEERIGHAVFVSTAQADVSVEGHIAPSAHGPGWRAVLVLRDAHGATLGSRELRRPEASCAGMREPLALVIAVMIDPDAATRPAPKPEPAPAPAPPPPPPPAPTPPVVIEKPVPVIVRVPEPAPPPPPAWRFDTGASVVGALGLLPDVGVGLFAHAILEPPKLIGLEGYGAVFLDDGAQAGAQGHATLSLALLGGGLCPLRLDFAPLQLYACASGQLGYLKSTGPASTADQHQVHVAGALEGRGTLRLFGPLTARGGLSVLVPIVREQFLYARPDGTQANLFRMAPVAAMADVGVGVSFP